MTRTLILLDDIFECPKCGAKTDLQNWDCMGLDDDDLCCNQCGWIGEPKEVVEKVETYPLFDREET